jgi:hypothetical protein
VVDFPFYVPFLLFAMGAYLGAFAMSLGSDRTDLRANAPTTPAVRWTLASAGLTLLAQPMLAQAATSHALAAMAQGRLDEGLYWQSVARRLEPRNHAHYWAEAVIWRQMAADSGERGQWARADRLLADGIRANAPYAFSLLLDRARMHRLHRGSLDNAAPADEIVRWVERAVAAAPRAVAGQAELARALAFAGRKDEARRIERSLQEREADHPLVRSLAQDLK